MAQIVIKRIGDGSTEFGGRILLLEPRIDIVESLVVVLVPKVYEIGQRRDQFSGQLEPVSPLVCPLASGSVVHASVPTSCASTNR